MNTISYLPDPGDAQKMICVVTDHGRFNLKQAVKDANDVALIHYDEYDHGNQMNAKKFLLASLEDDLWKQLLETVYKTDFFAAYWFELMGILKSESIDRFEIIKKKIKQISIDSYKQENIEEMASDYLTHYEELHSAAMTSTHKIPLALTKSPSTILFKNQS